MKYLILFVILGFLFSCKSASSVSDAQREDVFKEFTYLDLPVTDLRIGANYIEGIGVNGDGVSEAELYIQKSYSYGNLASSKNSKSKIDASLYGLLGLNSNLVKNDKIEIKYSNVEIVGIKDLFSIDIKTGVKYVYQGLKVNSFSIISDKSLTSEIKANLKANLQNASIEVTPIDSKDNISLSGEKIFIAYKLVSFGNLQSEIVERKEFSEKTFIGSEYDIHITNKDEILNCIEQYYPPNEINDFLSMEENYPDEMAWYTSSDKKNKAIWLFPDNCKETKYLINIEKLGNISAKNNIISVELPFLPKDQDIYYDLNKYLLGNFYVIDKILFHRIKFEHKEEDGWTSYYSFNGNASLVRFKYPIILN